MHHNKICTKIWKSLTFNLNMYPCIDRRIKYLTLMTFFVLCYDLCSLEKSFISDCSIFKNFLWKHPRIQIFFLRNLTVMLQYTKAKRGIVIKGRNMERTRTDLSWCIGIVSTCYKLLRLHLTSKRVSRQYYNIVSVIKYIVDIYIYIYIQGVLF